MLCFPACRSIETGITDTKYIRFMKYIVTRMSDYQRGFGLEIGFIDHFNTQPVTTLNSSAVADFHTSQITTAHVKTF
jgi:hypothetical protein